MENTNLKIFAKKYWELGFNVTCIVPEINEFNFNAPNILKTPNHEWTGLTNSRQEFNDIEKLDWDKACGIGAIMGTKNILNPKEYLYLIDFDGCDNYDFIISFLKILNLPENYEWVIRTGSGCGYHIYIFSDLDYSLVTKFKNFEKGCAYQSEYYNSLKIELLWETNAVLPPSLHMSTLRYEFINCFFPKNPPKSISFFDFLKATFNFCDTQDYCLTSDWWVDGFPRRFYINDSNELSNPVEFDEINEMIFNDTRYLVFDIETDGLIKTDFYPNILQITWYLISDTFRIFKRKTLCVRSENIMENKAFEINKLDFNLTQKFGVKLFDVLREFAADLFYAKVIVAHNIEFDLSIINYYLKQFNLPNYSKNKELICTMKSSISLFDDGNYPSLNKLYKKLYKNNNSILNFHNSEIDTYITVKCLFELIVRNIVDKENKYRGLDLDAGIFYIDEENDYKDNISEEDD